MGRTIKVTSFLLFLFFYSSALAQGQLFSIEEANQKFGPVLYSVDVPVSNIQSFTNQPVITHLMFRIQENQVIILDGRRNVLYPEDMTVNAEDVFTVFNVVVINELLLNGNGNFVTVEQRENVLSVSFGYMTMEVGTPCPPYCD